MRLLPSGSSPSTAVHSQTAQTPSGVIQEKQRGRSRQPPDATPAPTEGDAQGTPAAIASTIDYTRPTTSTELLMDLQRRVIKLEEFHVRKLSAGEFAIVIQATTGLSIEALTNNGYVVEKCHCEGRDCKGWRLVPVGHFRSADQGSFKDTSPVRRGELTDRSAEPQEPAEEPLEAIFQRMFKDGLLKKNTHGQTLIPADGPITWTHRQHLAFAQGFDLTDLLELEGKPRELQRQLITTLKEMGYTNILSSAPKKEKA